MISSWPISFIKRKSRIWIDDHTHIGYTWDKNKQGEKEESKLTEEEIQQSNLSWIKKPKKYTKCHMYIHEEWKQTSKKIQDYWFL